MDVRFGRMSLAVDKVAPKRRDAFLARRKTWPAASRSPTTSSSARKMMEDEDAEVVVKYDWYELAVGDLHTSKIRQKWHSIRGRGCSRARRSRRGHPGSWEKRSPIEVPAPLHERAVPDRFASATEAPSRLRSPAFGGGARFLLPRGALRRSRRGSGLLRDGAALGHALLLLHLRLATLHLLRVTTIEFAHLRLRAARPDWAAAFGRGAPCRKRRGSSRQASENQPRRQPSARGLGDRSESRPGSTRRPLPRGLALRVGTGC